MNISNMSSDDLRQLKVLIDKELATKVDVYSITLRLRVKPSRTDDIGCGRDAMEIADSIATLIGDTYKLSGFEDCGVYEATLI